MKFTNLIFLGLSLIAFSNCEKNNSTTLNIRLTDGPGDFQQVNINIREVRVKMANDTSDWISLQTNAGMYDLLLLQNGIDTLLATGPVPSDVLKEVRFILGDGCNVMVDSIVHPLETPSAEESGLKIKVDKDLNLDLITLLFDFDAEQSILKTGNGDYKLKPVIKVK